MTPEVVAHADDLDEDALHPRRCQHGHPVGEGRLTRTIGMASVTHTGRPAGTAMRAACSVVSKVVRRSRSSRSTPTSARMPAWS